MRKSIFPSNVKIITLISILLTLIFIYLYNHNEKDQLEYFIPSKPSMNEYYIHRAKVKTKQNLTKPTIKYFMAIPFGDNLVSKNNLWNMVRECNNNNKVKYVPNSFILENFYDLMEFKKTFNPEKIYILKKNTHRKQGIKLFKGSLPNIMNEYIDGNYKVIQEFLKEPYLINNRIVVLRLYLVILKNKEYSYYIHKYGKCLYTSKDFSLEGLEDERLITDNRSKLDKRFPKNIDDFILKENIKKTDLYKPIESIIGCFKKFISKTDESEQQQFTFFQIFGVDIILDKNKNPFLLEINKNPDINNIYYKEDQIEKKNLQSDTKNLVENNKITNFTII